MTSGSRKFFSVAATVLASVGMLVTLLAYYANHVVVNQSGFSNRAVSVVQSGPVQSVIVNTVTGRLLAYVGNQTSLQPIIEDAVREAVSSGRISGEVRAAANVLHSELLTGNAHTLTLTLPDIGSAIAPIVQSRSPQLAYEVNRIGTITVLDVPIPPSAATAVNDLVRVGRDWVLLLALTIGLVLLALIVSPSRGSTLIGLGLGAFAAGALAVAAYLIGRGVVVNEFSNPDARTAAQSAWSVYLSGLETSGFVLAGIGALAAVAGAFF